MSNRSTTDVLVVGAGPVGMLAALLLSEAGVRVTLIDREQRTAAHSYACGLHLRTLKLLARLGLLSDLLDTGRRIERVGLYSSQGRETEIKLSALEAEYPFVLVLPQSELEERLAERLKKKGVEILWHHRLSTLEPRQDEVFVEVDQLTGTATGYIVPHWEWVVRKTIPMTASFVVGADGQRSLVRRLLNIEQEQAAAPEFYVVYEFDAGGGVPDELCLVVQEGVRSVLWPLAENRCRWSFQLPEVHGLDDFAPKDRNAAWAESAEVAERTLTRLKQRLAARAPWFQAGVQKVHWAVDIQFQHHLARQFGKDRCWLVGDAVHQTSPAGIQSMNAGLLEAEHLAGCLAKVVRAGASRDVLNEYEKTHRLDWQLLLGLKGPPTPGPKAKPWVKEQGANLISSLPGTGSDLAAMLGQLDLSLPR